MCFSQTEPGLSRISAMDEKRYGLCTGKGSPNSLERRRRGFFLLQLARNEPIFFIKPSEAYHQRLGFIYHSFLILSFKRLCTQWRLIL